MSCYMISEVKIHNSETFEAYRATVQPLLEQYGGKYLARDANPANLSGKWMPSRIAIVEFPSRLHLENFWNASEHASAQWIRDLTAEVNVVVVDGIQPE